MSIKISHLSVCYDRQRILHNISFEAQEGEFVCVVGKSGCGKSSLLHAIAGFIPFSGDIQKTEAVGMVFQRNAVFPWMTVAENIAFAIRNHKHDKQEREQIVGEHLRLAQLEEKRNRYPVELSGGQVQRVAFARTLAQNPNLILMDEPFGSLDAFTREQMQNWLLSIWGTHRKTIVFVTHDIEEAIFLADRVLILKDGTVTHEFLISFGRPREETVKFTQEFNELKRKIHRSLA